ncbi:MAG: hypothetical protein JKY00_14285 [Roseicyclus sp.]|nr:hypothetical protein [Roseicyclus sp.]
MAGQCGYAHLALALFVRPTYLSGVIAYRLDGSNVANLVLATRLELRPGDVVFVAEQPVTRWNRVIDQITPSIINLGAAAVN